MTENVIGTSAITVGNISSANLAAIKVINDTFC